MNTVSWSGLLLGYGMSLQRESEQGGDFDEPDEADGYHCTNSS